MSPTHLFGRLHEAVRSADRILLVAHKKPDGDTLGSSSSALNWLLREGKDVTAFCRDLPPASFRYLDNIHRYTNDVTAFDRGYDLVVVFDSGDLHYCGVDDLLPRIQTPHILVNVDHHVTNRLFGHLNIVLTDASSTAEIMARFYESAGVTVDDRMATSILTGLLTDTSHFSNAATNPKSIEVAGSMLTSGARIHDISKHLLRNKSVDVLRVWGLLLSRLRHNPRYDAVTTYLLNADAADAAPDVVDGLSNFLNAVTAGTDAVLVLSERKDGTVKGSFRSVRRDVSQVAKLFGGGGHKKAAGFTVEGRIEETPDGPRIVPA